MGRSEERLEHAQARATRARDRLVADLLAIKERLMPARLFGDLWRKSKSTGAEAAAVSAEAIKARPGVAVGVVALAALFLARKPIARAISSRKPSARAVSPRKSATPPARTRSPVKRSRKAKP